MQNSANPEQEKYPSRLSAVMEGEGYEETLSALPQEMTAWVASPETMWREVCVCFNNKYPF